MSSYYSQGGSDSYGSGGSFGSDGSGIKNYSPVYDNLPLNGRIHITENVKYVIDIDASDDYDYEGNGLKYYIVGGKDRDFYEIDRDTGKLSFVEAPDFEKPLDYDGDNVYNVIVRAVDSYGAYTDQPLWVEVKDEPETPVAQDDEAFVQVEGQVGIYVLNNDYHPNGDGLRIDFPATDKISANGGTINLNNGGTPDDYSDDRLVYRPAADFIGVDSFNYAISDGNGGTDIATVKILVTLEDPNIEKNLIEGTDGDDLLEAPKGTTSEDIRGFAGNDTLRGFAAHDCLVGGADNDRLFGNDGNDILDGSDGENRGVGETDILTGGKGRDFFILGDDSGAYYLGNGNADFALIQDFEVGQDKLVLAGSANDYEFDGNEIRRDDGLDLVVNLGEVTTFELTEDDIIFV
ncbi:MAG: Ig-like domain-containing protein [Xenococcus sp. (in: cyanobacteria)]